MSRAFSDGNAKTDRRARLLVAGTLILAVMTGSVVTSQPSMAAARHVSHRQGLTANSTDNVAALTIKTNPGLTPAFSPAISDYVLTCKPGHSVRITGTAPAGDSVTIDGLPIRVNKPGKFHALVDLGVGQEFTIAVTQGQAVTDAYARCVPSDFPKFTPLTRDAGGQPPQAQFYVVLPFGAGAIVNPPYPNYYVVVLDDNGVPVWWKNTTTPDSTGTFGTMLANGDVAWTYNNNAPAQEVSLDGQSVRTISGSNGTTDLHELRLLPNGNYLISINTVETGVNLSAAWCATTPTACPLTSVSIFDPYVEEVTPTGSVVWEWDAATNIPITETDLAHRAAVVSQTVGGGLGAVKGVYDPYHVNAESAIAGSNDFLVSVPCMDAIYRITPSAVGSTTGTIDWKLGGLPDGHNLTILGDPDAPNTFGFQHDVISNADGTVTAYDDGIGFNRVPRDLQFSIDTTTSPGTATLIQSETYAPNTANIICCGSANILPGGDWLSGWGGLTSGVTEQTPGPNPKMVWGVDLPSGEFTYRVTPVLPGIVSTTQLRCGMDAQYGASTAHAY